MPSRTAATAYATSATATVPVTEDDPVLAAVLAATATATAVAPPPSTPQPAARPAPDPAPSAPTSGPGLRPGTQPGTWLVSAPTAGEALAAARAALGGDVDVLGGRRSRHGLLGRRTSFTLTVTAGPAPGAGEASAPAAPSVEPAFQATLTAALEAASVAARRAPAEPTPASADVADPVHRAALASLGVPESVLTGLMRRCAAGAPWMLALEAAITDAAPALLAAAPTPLAEGGAVVSGSGGAGAAAIVRALTVGISPGQLVRDGLVVPATAANLAGALSAAVRA